MFSLFIFLTMLMVAGLAIDMMRHEEVRVRMQGVSDRAVLAATMLGHNNGVATRQQLLQSYFTAAGLSAQLGNNYSITQGMWSGVNVRATPAATVPTLMSQLVGVNTLAVSTPSAAAESVISVWLDIVMVLDVSGSMAFNGGGRIINLRQAASQLATQVLTDNANGRVSLSLVPYDTAVYPPPAMLPFFNHLSGSQGACPDFQTWNSITNTRQAHLTRRMCHTDSWGMISPYMGQVAPAVAAINALQPRDVTSIDLGLRWGAAMFDSTLRPAFTQLINDGMISNDFDGRPFDWNESNVVRAIVLLTDGENCCGHRYTQAVQDMNTLSICQALKQRNVLVYTIAFEADPAGQVLMQNCASSPSHYFDASVGGLVNVFSSIASNVVTQTLRLTQ